MNKIKAIAVILIGINIGMDIASNIWNPSTEKILSAMFYGAAGIGCIFLIKE